MSLKILGKGAFRFVLCRDWAAEDLRKERLFSLYPFMGEAGDGLSEQCKPVLAIRHNRYAANASWGGWGEVRNGNLLDSVCSMFFRNQHGAEGVGGDGLIDTLAKHVKE